MARTKALPAEVIATLGALVQAVVDSNFGTQKEMGKKTGLSQAHLSNVIKGRGAGFHVLHALAQYRPADVARLLGIRPENIIALWSETSSHGAAVGELPEFARRAARAAVELWGCTPDEAVAATRKALEMASDEEKAAPLAFLGLLRPYLPSKVKSGVRRKTTS
ncbi:MAG TPA: hypothetical protein VFV10_15870 [Gammaproteobacteria bacterium]|nr:hypothetical protein [Gammaproteobacteria bacterium]